MLEIADSGSVLEVPVGCVIFSRLASVLLWKHTVQEVADKLQTSCRQVADKLQTSCRQVADKLQPYAMSAK